MTNDETPEIGQDSLLSDELDALLRRLGSESTSVVAGIFGNWAHLVGDTVALHASPGNTINGIDVRVKRIPRTS